MDEFPGLSVKAWSPSHEANPLRREAARLDRATESLIDEAICHIHQCASLTRRSLGLTDEAQNLTREAFCFNSR
jgi:hypothetical protein